MNERLRNGEYYAEGAKIFRAPVWTKNDEGGSTVSMGFHACTATDWCDPASVVSCLNASRHHEDLVKALEAACDYLTNAAIDLQSGYTKATAIKTINGGIKMVREALVKVAACPKK